MGTLSQLSARGCRFHTELSILRGSHLKLPDLTPSRIISPDLTSPHHGSPHLMSPDYHGVSLSPDLTSPHITSRCISLHHVMTSHPTLPHLEIDPEIHQRHYNKHALIR